MNIQSLLTPEAVATYIAALMSIIFGVAGFLISSWLNRVQPQKIIIQKISASEMLKISPNVLEGIAVTYNQKPIKSLYQTIFLIKNHGKEIVENVKLDINLQSINVLEISISNKNFDRDCTIKDGDNKFGLDISYLNPHTLYKDSVEVSIFSFERISFIQVSGGGKGWVSEYQEKNLKSNFQLLQITSEIQTPANKACT